MAVSSDARITRLARVVEQRPGRRRAALTGSLPALKRAVRVAGAAGARSTAAASAWAASEPSASTARGPTGPRTLRPAPAGRPSAPGGRTRAPRRVAERGGRDATGETCRMPAASSERHADARGARVEVAEHRPSGPGRRPCHVRRGDRPARARRCDPGLAARARSRRCSRRPARGPARAPASPPARARARAGPARDERVDGERLAGRAAAPADRGLVAAAREGCGGEDEEVDRSASLPADAGPPPVIDTWSPQPATPAPPPGRER